MRTYEQLSFGRPSLVTLVWSHLQEYVIDRHVRTCLPPSSGRQVVSRKPIICSQTDWPVIHNGKSLSSCLLSPTFQSVQVKAQLVVLQVCKVSLKLYKSIESVLVAPSLGRGAADPEESCDERESETKTNLQLKKWIRNCRCSLVWSMHRGSHSPMHLSFSPITRPGLQSPTSFYSWLQITCRPSRVDLLLHLSTTY